MLPKNSSAAGLFKQNYDKAVESIQRAGDVFRALNQEGGQFTPQYVSMVSDVCRECESTLTAVEKIAQTVPSPDNKEAAVLINELNALAQTTFKEASGVNVLGIATVPSGPTQGAEVESIAENTFKI